MNFWNSIVQKFVGFEYRAGPSGMGGSYFPKDFINGWILDFFLYDQKGNYIVDSFENIPIVEPKRLESDFRFAKFE